jgi:fumarate hydratase subunit alpha
MSRHRRGGCLRRAYTEEYLRVSMVYDPVFERKKHYEIVPSDRLKLIFAPKGAGSENTSRLAMIKLADGWKGVTRFVSETVKSQVPMLALPLRGV